MQLTVTPQIKKKMIRKIKKYSGIAVFIAALGLGSYEFMTVGRASAQTGPSAGQELRTTIHQEGSGSIDPKTEGSGNGGSGTEAPGNGSSGTETPGNGDPGNTNPGNQEPGPEGPGNGSLGNENSGTDTSNSGNGESEAVGSGTAATSGVMSYAVARAIQSGIVNANDGLRVRSGPGTNYAQIGSLANGTSVTILGEENGWYKIRYNSGEGYVSGQYIKLQEGDSGTIGDPDVDEAYAAQLEAAGFPRSYAVPLAGLHAKHPSWVFQPVQTGLDWNTVIEKESKLNVNMVPISANDGWKSTASGAYNWSNNKWTILDGSSWVAASPAIISYYMDPRNFLNETNIYQFETLKSQSYHSASDVQNILKGTFMSGALRDDSSTTYADTFVQAGVESEVSPLHLAARCRQEQGTAGTSPMISGTYSGFQGYYNYFNIEAFGTPVSVLYERGLTKAKKEGWNSVSASIRGGAKELAKRYVNVGQNTLYFQKFNVINPGSGLYQHQYMANVQAAVSEGKTMGNAYDNKERAFVFRIPIYSHMPENACAQPNSGNPNNWLKSLAVANYNLTPAFSGGTTEYSMIVGADIGSVTVQASPVASTSSVSGTGTVNLNYGSNLLKVSCKAQDGSLREYMIHIVRQGSPQHARGDVNGDGEITLKDMLKIKRHLLDIEVLQGESFKAADINGDGEITLKDMLKIKRHLLDIEIIK